MNFLKPKEQTQMEDQKQTPVLQAPIARRPRPLSEVAAQAAEHVNQIEMALEEALEKLAQERNRSHLLAERCSMLEGDLKEMMAQRDYHKQAHVLIVGSLRNSATILLDCLRETPPSAEPAQAPPAQIEAAIAGLAKDLGDRPSDELVG